MVEKIKIIFCDMCKLFWHSCFSVHGSIGTWPRPLAYTLWLLSATAAVAVTDSSCLQRLEYSLSGPLQRKLANLLASAIWLLLPGRGKKCHQLATRCQHFTTVDSAPCTPEKSPRSISQSSRSLHGGYRTGLGIQWLGADWQDFWMCSFLFGV